MKTIKSFDGFPCRLSKRVYIVTGSDSPSYKRGTLVRLISDRNKSNIGDHFDPEWYTTCRANAKTAEFCGIKKKNLLEIDAEFVEAFLKTFFHS